MSTFGQAGAEFGQYGVTFGQVWTSTFGRPGVYFGQEDSTFGQLALPELVLEGFSELLFGSSSVYNSLSEIRPSGIYELSFGQAFMVFGQDGQLQGFDSLAFGLGSVANASLGVFVSGFQAQAFGTQSFQNLDISVDFFGFDALAMGAEHIVDYYLSELYPAGFAATEWGDAWISNYVRTYYLDGIDALTFGSTTVYNQTAIVYPLPIPPEPVGTPAVGFNVSIYPMGWDSVQFGAAEFFDNSQRLPMSGFLSESFGLGMVRTSFVNIEGVSLNEVLEDGEPVVYNLNQVIAPQPPESEPENCGIPTVTNFDREVFPQAFEPLRFGYQILQRGLPPITPEGLSTLAMGTAWISNEIRTIHPLGFNALLFDAQAVENDADAFYPPGFESLEVAGPYVWQNLQFVLDVRVGETWALGNPFLADRVRTLSLEGRDSLDAGRPVVYNYQTIVRPTGWNSYQTSTTIVRDKAIRVRVDAGIPPGLAGEPWIYNRNRSIFPFGPLTEAMPGPRIELGIRPVYPAGIYDSVMGDSVRVEFLNREVRVVGWTGRMGNGSVFNWPQPPGSQQALAFGIDSMDFGSVHVTANSIEPQGFSSLLFGTPLVRGTLIELTGILGFDYGIPTFIVTQYVYPEGIRDQALYGKPQMSPLTVWAPFGAPGQAIENHGSAGNVIGYLEYPSLRDSKIPFGDKCTWFGTTAVSNLNQSVVAVGSDSLRFGNASVSRTGLIIVHVQGMSALRMSYHEVLGGYLTLGPTGFDAQQFGLANVAPPFDPTITTTTQGFDATVWGEAWISSRPQNVLALGADSMVFGGPKSPEHAGLWISHEYPPFNLSGFDAAEVGEPWVSNYIRYFDMDGFEALEVDETPPYPRAVISGSARLHIMGADHSAFGAAWVAHGVRTIGAYSVFHHVILPSPVVRGQFSAQVSGFASDTLGMPIVDQVEPGTIKARGHDSADFGLALIRSLIYPQGIAGVIGNHSVAAVIRPDGFESGEIGGLIPVGDGEHTCGSAARVVLAHGVMTEEIGELTVA